MELSGMLLSAAKAGGKVQKENTSVIPAASVTDKRDFVLIVVTSATHFSS
jgi:hypothetical protein